MSVADRRHQDVEPHMNKLSLLTTDATSGSQKAKAKRAKDKEVADSWEDEADDLSEEEAGTPTTPTARHTTAPPPTPASPSGGFHGDFQSPYDVSSDFLSADRAKSAGDRRPEKSTATAQRLIAGALGVRAPKKTEEMRAYEKATRENEKRRIEQEKEAKKKQEELTRKAQESVWED